MVDDGNYDAPSLERRAAAEAAAAAAATEHFAPEGGQDGSPLCGGVALALATFGTRRRAAATACGGSPEGKQPRVGRAGHARAATPLQGSGDRLWNNGSTATEAPLCRRFAGELRVLARGRGEDEDELAELAELDDEGRLRRRFRAGYEFAAAALRSSAPTPSGPSRTRGRSAPPSGALRNSPNSQAVVVVVVVVVVVCEQQQ